MDPVTQGFVGAALPQAANSRSRTMFAAVCGFIAGLLPDLDVLISSDTDPLLFLEYHRQFSHSLLFVPVGGFLTAGILFICLRTWIRLPFFSVWLFCTLGYGTHGILDAMTSYGTMLLWPFSEERVSFRLISVVDPLFTLPVTALVLVSVLRRKPVLARFALFWCAIYLCLALFQQHRVLNIAEELAAERGDTPIRFEAKPSFGNIIVWKTVYETEDRYVIDGVRALLSSELIEGSNIEKLNVARDLPWLPDESQQAIDIKRFQKLSDGYIALDPRNQNRVADVRYSMLPNEIAPLWSIELSKDAGLDDHAQFREHRERPREKLNELWSMIIGATGS